MYIFKAVFFVIYSDLMSYIYMYISIYILYSMRSHCLKTNFETCIAYINFETWIAYKVKKLLEM